MFSDHKSLKLDIKNKNFLAGQWQKKNEIKPQPSQKHTDLRGVGWGDGWKRWSRSRVHLWWAWEMHKITESYGTPETDIALYVNYSWI